MEKASPDPVSPRPVPPPRFSLGRRVGRGLVACLWVWTSAGTLSAATANVVVSPYPMALESFNRRNYERALTLLERSPADLSQEQRADVLNLRGAIYLRQGRYDEARAAFADAVRADPKLWAARFNEAEVSFRQHHYAASRQEFDDLLGHTSRVFHPEEHRFLDYKARLADLFAGREQPALDFIAGHRSDPAPPLAWYYLNAAVERRQDHPQKVEQWLAQADTQRTGDNVQPYAESFEGKHGGSESRSPNAGQTGLASERHPRRRTTDEHPSEVAQKSAPKPPSTRDSEGAESPARPPTAATLAMVELLPERSPEPESRDKVVVSDPAAPTFRFNAPPTPANRPAADDMPPAGPGVSTAAEDETSVPAQSGDHVAGVLAKPRRGHGAPTPSPTPTPTPQPSPPDEPSGNRVGTDSPAPDASPASSPAASPGATPTASVTPTPEPSASPVVNATAEYTQKYEAAYVKFLEKDYPAALSLLEEAEAVQPKQPQSATLRAQVFKQEYEAAYLAYRKGDYPPALALLDVADRAQPNYPDALNLRGLVYSKQRSYDRAETMFKKAVGVDPTLWAAKFNYAELPFNRGDYTTARGRFEDLLAETDAAKRPREAELTQYKVFLTLLLEGKTDQARSFMEHFNFSGATPAKYFCNAAMNFRAGTVDKATGWIDSAKREYPAQLVSIFVESFYRLGWMNDPSTAASGTALAAASPAAESAPGVSPSPTPAATATPQPSVVAASGTGPSPVPSTTPILVAAASPSATVSFATGPAPSAFPKASVPPVVPPAVAASPSPTAAAVPTSPAPTAVPKASASPSATPTPPAAPVTPTPTPRAVSTPVPPSSVTITPLPAASATASPTPRATVAATAVPSATVAPESSPEGQTEEKESFARDVLRLGIPLAVLLYGMYVVYRLQTAFARRKKRRRRAAKLASAVDHSPETESEKIETPR